jgi:hypothetical protein
MRLNIYDSSFCDICSVSGRKDSPITWCPDGRGNLDYQFYTNQEVFRPIKLNVKNIAWILEPPSILPAVYQNFNLIANRFSAILTHNSELLKYPHAKWIHGGGSYIGGFGGGEEKIYEKTKFCSIVSSDKMMCPLHVFRRQIADYMSNNKEYDVDVFGTCYWGWVPIIESLEHYKYSIVVENYIDELFWTEKLNNCFLTGTVPIYCGATKIGEKFNIDGIIQFSSFEQLLTILKEEKSRPKDRSEAIKENFETAKKYRIMESQIYNMIKDGEI